MGKNRAWTDWALDALLFGGFLLAFFLDVTGMENHQLLGVALGALLLVHLVRHWKWVCSVTRRLSACLSGRTLLYWLLDAGLLAGFAFIIFSGLLMSTWFALPLTDYPSWRDAHEVVSIVTLFFLTAKVFLHSRWILHTLGAALRAPAAAPAPSGSISRAQFLGLIGIVGAAATVAAARAAYDPPVESYGGTTPGNNMVPTPPVPVEAASGAALPTDSVRAPEQPAVAAESANEVALLPTATPTPAAAEPTAASCVVLCTRHCPFPGKCRRYVDTNINGWCDNGECM